MDYNIHGYVTLGQVQETIKDRYIKYKQNISFNEAVRLLYSSNKHTFIKPKLSFNTFWGNLSDEEFNDLIHKLPVEITYGMLTPDNGQINENMIIPGNRDVFFIKHINYIKNLFHSHDFFEINYVFYGQCIQIFEREQRILKEGEMCIIAPHSIHDVLPCENSLVVSILIRQSTFEHTFFNLLTQKNLLSIFFRNIFYGKNRKGNYLLFNTDNQSEIKMLLKNISMESYIMDSFSNTCCINFVNILFSNILRKYSDTICFYRFDSNEKEKIDFISILQYIQQNFQTLTLRSLANYFHYSEAYISKLIKTNTNMNFTTIITKLKMENSKKLLTNTNMSIEQIAEQNGYDSPDHFTRVFKKYYGVTPKSYRNMYYCKNNVISS
ncbi:helix-turn-helix domain-containing protein [Caloramator sp. E03]|uniref:AraC family transcriptional regulator n=1 Tax=Caloramator sp. E03 TaxID=2576307 RepID=UPI0011106C5D|nr:AraC family transcriptional regulator [Caloramator sp. E03]QCX34293.1 helix-turn-helix domain-containing protein [Caloramator sp. E03]